MQTISSIELSAMIRKFKKQNIMLIAAMGILGTFCIAACAIFSTIFPIPALIAIFAAFTFVFFGMFVALIAGDCSVKYIIIDDNVFVRKTVFGKHSVYLGNQYLGGLSSPKKSKPYLHLEVTLPNEKVINIYSIGRATLEIEIPKEKKTIKF